LGRGTSIIDVEIPRGVYCRTLQMVNILRKKTGKRPLKKLPVAVSSDATQCPIARAINGHADGDEISTKQFMISPPDFAEEFMNLIDDPDDDGDGKVRVRPVPKGPPLTSKEQASIKEEVAELVEEALEE